MDCAGVAGHLIAYHLANVADDERDAVETHLVACSACLRTYLALKRAADRAEVERPRPEVKARLRAEVQRAFPPRDGVSRTIARLRPRLLSRRIPLYQSVALAVLAAAVALAAPSVLRRVTRDGHTAAPSVDTSRTRAESLQIY